MMSIKIKFVRVVVMVSVGSALFACASPSPNDLQRQKEQLACVQLGIDPNSPELVSCVSDLDATLFGIDHLPS